MPGFAGLEVPGWAVVCFLALNLQKALGLFPIFALSWNAWTSIFSVS